MYKSIADLGMTSLHYYLFKLFNFKANYVAMWGSAPFNGSFYNSKIIHYSSASGTLDIITAIDGVYNNYKVGVNMIDLTQMFGSDAGIVSALGLSSTSEITTNKAVQAFERMFPSSYYADMKKLPQINTLSLVQYL